MSFFNFFKFNSKLSDFDFYLFLLTFISSLFVKYKIAEIGIPIYALFGGLLFLRILFLSKSEYKVNRFLLVTFIAFVISLLISSILAEYQTLALKQFTKYLVYIVIGFFSFFIFEKLNYRHNFRSFFLRMISLIAFLGLLEAVYPNLVLFDFFRTERSLLISPRVSSILQWPNQYGVILAFSLFLIPFNGWKNFIFIFLISSQVCLSGSRNALLALGVVLTYKIIKKEMLFVLVTVVFVLMVTPFRSMVKARGGFVDENLVLADHLSSGGSVANLMKGGGVDLKTTVSLRQKLWEGGIETFYLNGIFWGIGLDNFRKVVTTKYMKHHSFRDLNAHNILINFLVEWGGVGFSAFVLLIILIIRLNASFDFVFLLFFFFSVQMFDCFNYDVFFMCSIISLSTMTYRKTLAQEYS